MALLYDAATMSTGVDSIDTQHKALIDDLNRLLAAMATGQGSASLDALVAKLGAYAATHFKHEESCMARYSCPSAAANIAAHKKFVDVFTAIGAELKAKGPSAALTLRTKSELVEWLGSHIKKIDVTLRPYVK